jgi:sugar phosphate isomerase/epimerase
MVSPLDMFERIKLVAAAGFKGKGFLYPDLNALQERRGTSISADVAAAVSDAGLDFVEVEFLTGWYARDPEQQKIARQKADLLFDWAAALGAQQVKVGTAIGAPRTDLDEIIDGFGTLCERAEAVGTRLALEPQPWTEVATAAEALRVVQGVASPAGGLLIDAWHANRGGWDLDAFAEEADPRVIAVELDDADRTPVGTLFEDSINGRKLCGEGSFDLRSFIIAMRRTGFDGHWGVEILSPELRASPVDVALRKVYETTMRQFEAL